MRLAPHSTSPNYYFLNDHCLCLEFGKEISTLCSTKILTLWQQLQNNPLIKDLNIHDIVPTYTSLAFYFTGYIDSPSSFAQQITEEVQQHLNHPEQSKAPTGATHNLPTAYNGEDIKHVAENKGLSIQQVIELHQDSLYDVAMIGFMPHFPYLLGLSEQLHCARRDQPRKKVKAGAVAIGGQQTGIYPSESPGGWQIIAYTEPSLLTTIQPGDKVKFVTGNHG